VHVELSRRNVHGIRCAGIGVRSGVPGSIVRVGATLLLALVLLVGSPIAAAAQERTDDRTSFAVEVLRDPTVYVPSALLYTSMRLDWNSSQPFFQHGFLEQNARYTQSGRSMDTPLSYSAGNQQILKDALLILPVSFVNSAMAHFVERKMSDRFPEHRKLWKTLSWVERAAFAGIASYQISSPHFHQWQLNQQLAQQYGFVQP
jgi:hypothetical protein